ncbi:RHS repeat-associated core domain-containing protein [Chryseobacterium sp. 2R14A]|uniref:RHS repeat-associated core domain-containing protein n=1 Tax=Chryseobacterium sp. 2R14A TaxID=3380353 RepID=UPI003CED4E72
MIIELFSYTSSKQIIPSSAVTNYVYRADRVKVKKLFNGLETDYLDGFQYKFTNAWEDESGQMMNDEMRLRIIPTSEGYFDALRNRYFYNYTDHLGNVRLSYSDADGNGEVTGDIVVNNCYNTPDGQVCNNYIITGEAEGVTNYYPFGLMHNAQTHSFDNAYQYKYNGKELQETGMYDYGARFYMPDIGRWGVVDPLAEKHPNLNPMMYAANNPIMMIDPDGRDWTITETYNKKTNTTNYHLAFTGAVLNSSSNKKIDMGKFANSIKSQTEKFFNKIENNPNITISSSINITVIDDKKDLKSSDTLIEIKDSNSPDFAVYSGKTEVAAREMNGKEVSVNEKYIGDMISGKNNKTMPHELGHLGGMQHPDQQTAKNFYDPDMYFPGWGVPSTNFMRRGRITNPTGPTVSQIERMYRLYKAGKLNNKNIEPQNER